MPYFPRQFNASDIDVSGKADLSGADFSGNVSAPFMALGIGGLAVDTVDSNALGALTIVSPLQLQSGTLKLWDSAADAYRTIQMGDSELLLNGMDVSGAETIYATTMVAQTFNGSGANLSNISASGLTGTVGIAHGGTGSATTAINQIFAGPSSGSTGAPSFRTMVQADVPSLAQSKVIGLTGTVASLQSGVDTSNAHIAATTSVHGATSANTASTIVSRDASGKFSAGNITASRLDLGSPSTAQTAQITASVIPFSSFVQTLGINIGQYNPGNILASAAAILLKSTDESATGAMEFWLNIGNVGPSKVFELLSDGTMNLTYGDMTMVGKMTTAGVKLTGVSSAPSSPTAGQLYFNSTDKHIYCWNGTAWKQLDN